ncbi:2OG-Fe(II) oxygenase [Ferrovibrio sp.]|uniref:2OG-Fe(II) oxygenase family protein n=1 Tax=Ferrovibrio sp. TaxID=1917215 RepID=UPI0025B91AF2|nr:2OG-Fe(II) oxygenase [Ferrovibrio sp.]MBX3453491.1 2OG-Fe(II) oxygenase [Ferrovibrio sp.]
MPTGTAREKATQKAAQKAPPAPRHRVGLGYGEPAPQIYVLTSQEKRAPFGGLGGRYSLICFFGGLVAPQAQQAVQAMLARLAVNPGFNRWESHALVAVSSHPNDAQHPLIAELHKRMLVIFDHDQALLKAWNLAQRRPDGLLDVSACWYLLDPQLRVLANWPLHQAEAAMDALAALGAPDDHAGVPQFAPALLVPRVFEPEFCRRLIAEYESNGGETSGVTKEIAGRTEVVDSPDFKRRRDHMIQDEGLRNDIRARLQLRLLPEISKAFHFDCSRLERYIVACYEQQDGGFFKPHRDNTTKGTAHRRFAVTINLNAEDYQGGDLRFPEFGSQTYRAPSGGAVVFSCSLLHEAQPVTAGRRYAFLPFLYDEAASDLRDANSQYLGESISTGQALPDSGKQAAE